MGIFDAKFITGLPADTDFVKQTIAFVPAQSAYTLLTVPRLDSMSVHVLKGAKLDEGIDYTISGNQILLTLASDNVSILDASDSIVCQYVF